MSQVFAAINHRLSDEYVKIELPSQQAKERYVPQFCFISRHSTCSCSAFFLLREGELAARCYSFTVFEFSIHRGFD
jgi:hypothetical protein